MSINMAEVGGGKCTVASDCIKKISKLQPGFAAGCIRTAITTRTCRPPPASDNSHSDSSSSGFLWQLYLSDTWRQCNKTWQSNNVWFSGPYQPLVLSEWRINRLSNFSRWMARHWATGNEASLHQRSIVWLRDRRLFGSQPLIASLTYLPTALAAEPTLSSTYRRQEIVLRHANVAWTMTDMCIYVHSSQTRQRRPNDDNGDHRMTQARMRYDTDTERDTKKSDSMCDFCGQKKTKKLRFFCSRGHEADLRASHIQPETAIKQNNYCLSDAPRALE